MAPELKTKTLQIRLDSPQGPDKFFVRNFSVAEGISRLFRVEVETQSADKAVDLQELLGQSMTLQVLTHSGEHVCFNGIVSRARQPGVTVNYADYVFEIVPSLWLLSIGRNSRIFQNKTAPDVIHEVIEAAGAGIKIDDRLEQTYETREYCVQYQESDFAFISRLMEQYGIFYYFTHNDDKHTLVLADKAAHHDESPVESAFEFLPTGGLRQDQDYIATFEIERSLVPGTHSTTDYNFKTPGSRLLVTEKGAEARELFEYPGGFERRAVGEFHARARLEEQEWPRHIAVGVGDCRALRSGHKFTLSKHFRRDCDGSYVVVQATHHAGQAGQLGSESRDGGDAVDYRVEFTVIPADVPYRAPRTTPRPRIFGSQSAVVVGKKGEEIWTDKYGRVKVQFFWDREGRNDENSSCWIRAAFGVAGKTWGQVFIPRIGQEVLVSFMEGDPDRPIIVGGVYNDEQMPPYELPGEQTKSTLKSRSSKGGGPANFNEIRFEDKKGEEEIYIHAEKNHTNITENDRSEDVGHDRSLHVGNDKSESIDKSKTITVGVDHTESIGANKSLTVGANHDETIGSSKTLSVGVDHTETIGSSMMISVGTMLTEIVGVNYAETVGAAMELTIGAVFTETVGGAKIQTIGAAQVVNVAGNRTDNVGGKMVQSVGKDLDVTVSGANKKEVAKEFELSAKKVKVTAQDEIVLVTGQSQITLKKDGSIKIKGMKISVEGTQKIEQTGMEIKSEAQMKNEVKGTMVTVEASGINTIKGALVKIN